MHLDKYSLPVQADGDANDQLQRVGMVVAGSILSGALWGVDENCRKALVGALQPAPGIYTRYVGGDPNNVSADQLIAVLAAHVASNKSVQVRRIAKACIKRFGFAQNTRDGLNEDKRWKLPDFMALRALPLFARGHVLLYPLALAFDVLLLFQALAAVGPTFRDGSLVPRKRTPDDVDDNCTIATLAVCRARMPTPLSWLATKIYAKLRPWNLGCAEMKKPYAGGALMSMDNNAHHPVYGALRWYHRVEAGGNPEIAEIWAPICKQYFE